MKFCKRYSAMISAIVGSFTIIFSFYYEQFSLIIGIFFIIALFFLIYKRMPPQIIFAVFCVICIIMSMLITAKNINQNKQFHQKNVEGSFVVTQKPTYHGEGYYSFTVKADSAQPLLKGRRILLGGFSDKAHNLRTGDIINAKISLEFSGYTNFDLSNFSNEIYLVGYFKEYEKFGKRDKLYGFTGDVQEYICKHFFSFLGDDEAATLIALTTGDRTYMKKSFYEYVKRAGVAHVMVVSGMHLAIIMNIITKITNSLFYNRLIKAAVIVFSVLFITAACGFTVSIIRAGVTYLFVALSFLLNRPNTPTNTLGAAVTLILIISPMALFNIAFLLSVLSTYGVLVVSPAFSNAFKKYLKIKSELIIYITDIISVTLSAMLMTLPVTIYYFGYISIVAVLTNILISFAATVSLSIAVLALFFSLFCKALSTPLTIAAGIIAKYINSVIVFLGSMPFATVDIPRKLFFLGIILIICVISLLITCKYYLYMLKLNELRNKVKNEKGEKIKWR